MKKKEHQSFSEQKIRHYQITAESLTQPGKPDKPAVVMRRPPNGLAPSHSLLEATPLWAPQSVKSKPYFSIPLSLERGNESASFQKLLWVTCWQGQYRSVPQTGRWGGGGNHRWQITFLSLLRSYGIWEGFKYQVSARQWWRMPLTQH